jgi:AcrR family transcriptional regulator
MPQNDTVDRILNAATILFAERGFSETSLRTITSTADVNLAAVNYHFGSKKELIQAVFNRFFVPFCYELDKQCDAIEKRLIAGQTVKLDTILRGALHALMLATEEIGERPQRFMRLVSFGYSQPQEHLRQFLVANFSGTYARFTALVKQAMPQLDRTVFYWRLYFMLGAAVFNLSSYDTIRAILQLEYNEDTSLEEAVNLLIPSLVGILDAPNVSK